MCGTWDVIGQTQNLFKTCHFASNLKEVGILELYIRWLEICGYKHCKTVGLHTRILLESRKNHSCKAILVYVGQERLL